MIATPMKPHFPAARCQNTSIHFRHAPLDSKAAFAFLTSVFDGVVPGLTISSDLKKGLYNLARRKSCALMATMTVLADIRTAATAGGRRMPREARTPAANGIATML